VLTGFFIFGEKIMTTDVERVQLIRDCRTMIQTKVDAANHELEVAIYNEKEAERRRFNAQKAALFWENELSAFNTRYPEE
jgi:hypothetical protein